MWVLTDMGVARVGNDGVEATLDSLPPVGAFTDARDGGNGRTWLLAENGAVLLSPGDLVEATLTGINPLDISAAQSARHGGWCASIPRIDHFLPPTSRYQHNESRLYWESEMSSTIGISSGLGPPKGFIASEDSSARSLLSVLRLRAHRPHRFPAVACVPGSCWGSAMAISRLSAEITYRAMTRCRILSLGSM